MKKPIYKKWWFWLIIVVFSLDVVLIAAFGGDDDPETEPQNVESTISAQPTASPLAEISAPTETPEPVEETPSGLSVDAIVALLNVSLRDSWGDHYRIDRNDNFVTVNVWNDGVAAEATAAKLGNQDYLASWNNLVEKMVDVQKSYQSTFRDNGNEDTIVVINILNDLNLDNLLLCITAGIVMYDDVNGVNLLGTE